MFAAAPTPRMSAMGIRRDDGLHWVKKTMVSLGWESHFLPSRDSRMSIEHAVLNQRDCARVANGSPRVTLVLLAPSQDERGFWCCSKLITTARKIALGKVPKEGTRVEVDVGY
jgi:hypothetical protein